MVIERVRPTVERWQGRHWWRSVSPTLQPTATAVSAYVRTRVSDLDRQWEDRCNETSDLVTGFLTDLEPQELGALEEERFVRISEKLRWRELRALLVSHLAAEIVDRVTGDAQPLLDELERVSLFGHQSPLTVGGLPAFDKTCGDMSPQAIVPAAYQALVVAIDARSAEPVDAYLHDAGITPVDGELQTLLEADQPTTAGRLQRALTLRSPSAPRLVVDLAGVEPVVRVGVEHEPVDVGVPPWMGPDAAHG